jgi:hypothetical protein
LLCIIILPHYKYGTNAGIHAGQNEYHARKDICQPTKGEMEALVASPTSWININQEQMRARVSAIQYRMEAMMKCIQEETKVAINSVWGELEETMKHRLEDILSCVNQRSQGLCRELNEKMGEMQVDLQTVKMSLNTWTKNLQETLADTRKDLHEELGFMFHKIEVQVDIKQVEAIVAVATASWDPAALRREQLNNQDIGPILEEVEAGQCPDSPTYRSYWAQWKSLTVRNSILKCHWESTNG